MKKFFAQLLFGNLTSKLMLITSDALIAIALPSSSFGAFALVQGLILSGAVVSVWGNDQAVINMIGRTDSMRHNVFGYLIETQRKVFLQSLVVAVIVSLIAMGSSVALESEILFVLLIITMLEAQLIINSAVFRALSRPYLAVFFFDGVRHLVLVIGAILVFSKQGGFDILIYLWLVGSVLSYFVGSSKLRKIYIGSGISRISNVDRDHVGEIAIFSGLWAVIQTTISRLILVFSAYLLSPDELGVVAFFLKLLVVFTFLQTVMVQAVAPIIGRVSNSENYDQAKKVYSITTFLLAAVVTPWIGACLLVIDEVELYFSVGYTGGAVALIVLFLVQALNIGTGIIGQFIIHFGYSRELLIISACGSVFQILYLLSIGNEGPEAIFIAYAATSLLLVVLKNCLAYKKVGFHGFQQANLIIIIAVALEVVFVHLFQLPEKIGVMWSLLYHSIYCVLVIFIALTRSPDIIEWMKIRMHQNA